MAAEWENILTKFLTENGGKEAIKTALKSYLERSGVRRSENGNMCSVEFDGMTFMDGCLPVLTAFQKTPVTTLLRCHDILNRCKDGLEPSQLLIDSPILRFRLNSLPPGQEFQLVRVPRGEDAGHLIELSGTVVKVTSPRVLSSAKSFLCGACKQTTVVPADHEQFYACPAPTKCDQCSESGHFKPLSVEENAVYMAKDYQEVKLQEKLGNLNMGAIPRSIWVTLDDDLVDRCKPGDDIRVVGVVIRRWQPLGKGPEGQTDIELAISANFIQVLNDQKSHRRLTDEQTEEFRGFWQNYSDNELKGRNEILASFCPQVYGLYTMKLAVCIVLCGGVERSDASGLRVRGESHMLMVGDPGTGKSQILRYAAKLTPRSVLTSGIGSTNAGLTVSAIRDGGQWSLEAGALVLADGGICCIDEFSSIRETDRVAIHEAMEQQCISVAKAGVVTRLQSRCSILATANPKGKYDPEQPLTVNIGVASPLLSRFDLVFVLLDSKNPDWDAIVSSYILEGKDPMKESSSVETTLWNFDKLQAFFVFCKHVNPTMAQDSSLVLSKYYQKQRGSDGVNMARATVRLLQSCIRLAQGHARLMNHDEVTICDAINAIVLLELSFDSNPSFLSGINPLHTTFPADPLEEYKIQAEVILTGLGLSQLWDKEKRRLQGQLTVIKEKPRPMEQSPRPLTKSQRPLEQIQRLKCGDEKEQEAVVMVADCSRLSQKRKRSDEEEEDSSLFSFGATQDKEYTSSTPINTSRSDVKAKLKAFKAPLEMSQLSSQVRFRFKKINTSDEIK